MTTPHETNPAQPASPSGPPTPGVGAGGDCAEARQRLEEMTAAGEAALATIAAELGDRAPPPASQSAHAVWIGTLMVGLFLAGTRGLGADTPVITLITVGVAGGLIFSISWFERRAAERAHALGRQEMGRAIAQKVGETRVADSREWLQREGRL